MKIIDSTLCTSCGACVNICPSKAITLVENEQGTLVYNIDDAKCVSCNLCSKVCPIRNSVESRSPKECYAAYCVEKSLRRWSSSGGVVSALAQYYFKNKGEVIAAGYHEGKVQFDIYVDGEQWKAAKGSYYVKAYTNKIYQEVAQRISCGKETLFIGLPCQVAGLYNFLKIKKTEIFAKNLVTVDLICHGAPSHVYLTQHIGFICNKNKLSQPDKITFRDGLFYRLRIEKNEIKIFEKTDDEDTYFTSFLQGVIFPEACHTCKYARIERVGDLTVGDFWGLQGENLQKGTDSPVSLVLVNSTKGDRLLKSVNESLYLEKRNIQEAISHNRQLTRPTQKHPDRVKFLQKYRRCRNFDKAIRTTRIPLFILKTKIKKKLKAWIFRRK